jgi:hypothetical protein
MLSYRLLDDAREEMRQLLNWYEEKRVGSIPKLLKEFTRFFRLITDNHCAFARLRVWHGARAVGTFDSVQHLAVQSSSSTKSSKTNCASCRSRIRDGNVGLGESGWVRFEHHE